MRQLFFEQLKYRCTKLETFQMGLLGTCMSNIDVFQCNEPGVNLPSNVTKKIWKDMSQGFEHDNH